MPANKSCFIRYIIIIKALKHGTRNTFITKNDLVHIVAEKLDTYISKSTIDKDLHALRYCEEIKIFAPIKYSRITACTPEPGGYYIDGDWNFFDQLKKEWE